MMEANELQQRFSQVENTIHHAAQRCEHVQTVPMDVKDRIQHLDQMAMHARSLMQSQDEYQIRQCVDEMEELGDLARDAVEYSTAPIDGELKNAVLQAHRELSELKHRLH
ncbi:MAG: hypothetical protein ACREX0_04510 [Noviherbaspirillum sp.]